MVAWQDWGRLVRAGLGAVLAIALIAAAHSSVRNAAGSAESNEMVMQSLGEGSMFGTMAMVTRTFPRQALLDTERHCDSAEWVVCQVQNTRARASEKPWENPTELQNMNSVDRGRGGERHSSHHSDSFHDSKPRTLHGADQVTSSTCLCRRSAADNF